MKRTKPQPINITPDETAPAVLAAAVVETAKAAKRLLNSGLSREAIALLVSHNMRATDRLSPRQVLQVLEAAANLNRWTR